MDAHVLVVEPSGEFRLAKIDPRDFTSFTKLVNGHLLEAVMLSDDIHVYVNEEGKLRGYWSNPVATNFVDRFISAFSSHDYIAGTMVISEHDHSGNDISLTCPGMWMDMLTSCGGRDVTGP